MVGGFEKNQERRNALALLGKDLARRAHSHCELCGASGVKFYTREIEPVPEEPDINHCLLICARCSAQLDRRGAPDNKYWRCLETSAWNELPVVQVTAVRLLRAMQAPWADQLLEQLYIWPGVASWLAGERAESG